MSPQPILVFDHRPPSEDLVDTMKQQLERLTFHALALCVQQLLVNMGYQEVSLLQRTFLRGRTDHSGIDIVAKQKTPLGLLPAVIQLRHRKQTVAKNGVHSFIGAMQCYGAPVGILITTKKFAPPALETVKCLPGEPIQLVDLDQLARLMVAYRIGVQDIVDPQTGSHKLQFFPEIFEARERYADAYRRNITNSIWGFN